MKLAVVVVAFIAGYAIVSFVVRKLKEGPFNKELTGRNPHVPPTEATPNLESDFGHGFRQPPEDDREHPEDKL